MRKRWRGLAGLLLAAVAAGVGWSAWRAQSVKGAAALPTAPARATDFQVMVRCRGELKALRSRQITAPSNVPELRIVWQAPAGTVVKEGEPVLRFDPSSAQRQLQEQTAALNQAQAALDQAVAQSKVTSEQDKIDLNSSHYDVERAKIDVRISAVESRLKAEESAVNLGLAQRKQSVQSAKVDLNRASDEARIASLTRVRDKARDDLELTQDRLRQLEIKAPISGLVQYLPNYSQGWMNAKPFAIGDQVWPGAPVAEMPDLGSLEMEGKIEEIDRGRVEAGQEVRVKVDALPEVTLSATLTTLSPMTVMSFDWPATRTFRGSAHIDKPDARLRPAMNGQIDIIVQRLPGAISVPAKAVFTRDGKPVVYVAGSGAPRAVAVEVLARNPDEVAVKGIAAGVQVALVEPGVTEKKGS